MPTNDFQPLAMIAMLILERYRLGSIHHQGHQPKTGEEIPSSDLSELIVLEKIYTDKQEPSPADIRPLPVLKQTLQLLKRKWKENHNYAYAVDQFKSMRQDLTVCRKIFSRFPVMCLSGTCLSATSQKVKLIPGATNQKRVYGRSLRDPRSYRS